MDDQDVKPWDKQPEETNKRYAAFCLFRDLGSNRSLVAVSKAQGRKSVELINTWSWRHKWFDRAEQYDIYRDRQKREAEEQADIAIWKSRRKKYKESQYLAGTNMMTIGAKALVYIDKDPQMIEPRDAVKLIEAGSVQVSKAIGEPDTITEQRGGTNQNAIIDSDFAKTLLNWAINPRGAGKDENTNG